MYKLVAGGWVPHDPYQDPEGWVRYFADQAAGLPSPKSIPIRGTAKKEPERVQVVLVSGLLN